MANSLVRYIKDSLEEMKKVTWPTKKEAKRYTIQVIAISVAVASFLGGLDKLFSTIIQKFI